MREESNAKAVQQLKQHNRMKAKPEIRISNSIGWTEMGKSEKTSLLADIEIKVLFGINFTILNSLLSTILYISIYIILDT